MVPSRWSALYSCGALESGIRACLLHLCPACPRLGRFPDIFPTIRLYVYTCVCARVHPHGLAVKSMECINDVNLALTRLPN